MADTLAVRRPRSCTVVKHLRNKQQILDRFKVSVVHRGQGEATTKTRCCDPCIVRRNGTASCKGGGADASPPSSDPAIIRKHDYATQPVFE